MKNWIIAVMVLLALLGLAWVQVYLLRVGLLLEKARFDPKMAAVLEQVNISIEKSKEVRAMVIEAYRDTVQREEVRRPLRDSLEDILSRELLSRGISVDFALTLWDGYEKQAVLTFPGADRSDQPAYQHYQRTLYGRIGADCGCRPVLEVQVTNLLGYLLGRLTSLIVLSVLFVGLLAFSLGWLIIKTNRLRKLDQVKNDFINNLTHELKTPAFSTSLLLRLLSEALSGKKTEKAAEYLALLERENEQLKDHIEKVLELASLESGQKHIQARPIHVHELLEEVCRDYARKSEEKEGRLEFQLDAANDLAELDSVHVKNAVQNLLENALKYTDKPPVIRVSTHNAGPFIHIRIRDRGIGIAPEHQKKIFDKFYRAPTGNLHEVTGFGLGLHYVRQIVQAHGGRIQLQSRPGEGSEFELIFNLAGKEAIIE
ncbi:MAG: HAMP domain-containing histidine kinase [Lewinellaceae bacterium]|nr:HAMP domain-containing histidine kinase [Lewinellaceae bacterium]